MHPGQERYSIIPSQHTACLEQWLDIKVCIPGTWSTISTYVSPFRTYVRNVDDRFRPCRHGVFLAVMYSSNVGRAPSDSYPRTDEQGWHHPSAILPRLQCHSDGSGNALRGAD